MRVVGLDIHPVFAEAVMLDDGKVVRLGRVGQRHHQCHHDGTTTQHSVMRKSKRAKHRG